VVLRDVHRQCRYIISAAYTERCTAFVHANPRPISTRAANRQDYRVRVQKNLVVCAPALDSMRASTRAHAARRITGVCMCACFNLLSCSDRGRGTNAAQASVLVSRIPSTFSLVAPRDTARFTLSLIPSPPPCLVTGTVVGRTRARGRCQGESRPIALPLCQPGALVKCFSSRIMTRSARL